MIKLLDISFWQDTIDFAKLKSAGYDHVILRAGYGTTEDSKFDEHISGCLKAGVNVAGVYWFIYATNTDEVKANANKCLEIIKPYNIPIVFCDFEYDTVSKAAKKGVTLGAKECDDFTIAFCETVKKAGYTPGYYANVDYYNRMYSSKVKDKGYVFWLAHYKSDYSYHTPPISCDFFQYTDRETVSGLTGKKFDANVCFSEKYLNLSASNSSNNSQGGNTMSKNIIQKVIDDAVEFAVSIANDNTHGYSQQVRSLFNIANPKSFDCSSLVITSFYYAFVKNGLAEQAEYLKSHCSYTGNMMYMTNCGFEVVAYNQTAHASMVKGDIELNKVHHTALAIDRDNIVHARTSEGTRNTIDDSGNEIRVQPWYLYGKGWDVRLRFTGKGIDFSNLTYSDASLPSPSAPSAPSAPTGNTLIKNAQSFLNKYFDAKISTDGIIGTKTRTAYKKAIQTALNKVYGANLVVDGILGTKSKTALNRVIVKRGSVNHFVTVVEIGLLLNKIDPKGVEFPGNFGSGLEAAIYKFQQDNGLVADKICGKNTIYKLLSNIGC